MNFKIWNKEIFFDENTLEIIVDNKRIKPDIRTYGQMRDLYIEKEKISDDTPLYLMYRDFYVNEDDKKLFKENNFRYDVTIILPKIIWKEYNKTFWHYHPQNSNWKFYEEVYQVLKGKAVYLQQNQQESFFTNAEEGDIVLMKEWFWHTTINPNEKEILVMANIVSSKFSSIYDDYKGKKWARYYLTTSWWIKNPNYQDNVDLQEKNLKLEIENLYNDFLKNPKKFSFLN